MSITKSLTRAALCIPIASLLATAACSSSSPGTQSQKSDSTTSAAALDAPNGGLDLTSKEAPAFGDPEVEALPLMSDALVSPSGPANPPPVPKTPQDSTEPAAPAYRLALVWGHLPPAHDADGTDIPAHVAQWTGSIGLSAGSVTLLRTIAFQANDAITQSSVAQSVTFDSQTDGYVEGVLLRVVIPEGAPATVQFATGLLTTGIDLTRLGDSPGGVVNAADGVSGVAWIGFPESTCTGGFVLGRWLKDEPALGRSFGVVSDADGAFLGYVRGPWGYAPGRANEVWFHKYIDAAGNPKGLVFGSYGDGAGHGLWGATDENDTSALDTGKLQGFYSDADDTGDGRGVWFGRWAGPCLP